MLLTLLVSLIAASQPQCNGAEWRDCLAKNEAQIIAKTPGVIRHGKTLVVGPTGHAAVFVDRYFPDDDVYNYNKYLRGRLRQSGAGSRWLVIDTYLWEGFHTDLVNLVNGAQMPVEGEFVHSPNRNRFAALAADNGIGYGPNQVEIFSLDEMGIKSEYRIANEDFSWQPVDGRWLGDDTFTYFQEAPDRQSPCNKKQILLRIKSGVWIEEAKPCE